MVDAVDLVKAGLADRYKIQKNGSGGMAKVYLAEDRKHRRPVALKIFRPESPDGHGAHRFLREIESVAHLTHPHILPLHDSGEVEGIPYYVAPYVDGGSLRDWLNREKQLPLDQTLGIAQQVAEALHFAHGKNLVHRDFPLAAQVSVATIARPVLRASQTPIILGAT